MSTIKIAIDGPAGAGKSTIAKYIAKTMGYVYIDTGAMYRSVALWCLRHGIDPNDEEASAEAMDSIIIDMQYENGELQIYLCGENVTGLIRTPEVSMGASDVSRHLVVRERLVEMQRALAMKYNVVMDGRDIATKVMPDADVAIFLTADAEARAKRRFDELVAKGDNSATFEEVLADMKVRDKNDSTRANSPLRQAENAILVDTTYCTLEESIEKVTSIVLQKVGEEQNV